MKQNHYIKYLCLFFVLYSHCSFAEFRTGFIAGDQGYEPKAKSFFSSQKEVLLPNPQDKTIIIYQHGHGPALQEEDCRKWYNATPESLVAIEDKNTKIFYICSDVADDPGKPGSLLYKRADEFKNAINTFVKLGVKKERIFLSGHSTGGWAILLLQKDEPNIGGSILYAPAATGKKSDAEKYPVWKNTMRPKWVKEILEASKINSLIFAYYEDPNEGPEDLEFLKLKSPSSVEIIAYKCPLAAPDQHFVPLNDCRLEDSVKAIKKYIAVK